jgi:hypothetical protein
VLAIGASVAVLIHHAPVAAPKAEAGRTARLPPARVSPRPAKRPTAHAAPRAAVLEPPAPPALGYLESAVLTLSPPGCGPGSTCTLMSRIDLGPHPQKSFQENSAVAFFVYLVGSPEVTPDLHHVSGRHCSGFLLPVRCGCVGGRFDSTAGE